MYKQDNYTEISKPNLTYQKENNIVKNYIFEESNRINLFKFKIEEKFPLVHYIYLMLFSKIYNRMNNFGIQNKNNFDFHFQLLKSRKTAEAITPKILKQLPQPQANQITTEVLSTAKDPSNYHGREVLKNEQVPIDFETTDDELVRPTMFSISNTVDENVVKQRVAKRKMLEKQVSENTARKHMNKIKKCDKL